MYLKRSYNHFETELLDNRVYSGGFCIYCIQEHFFLNAS
jgi:hypothetical protein